MSAIEPLPLVSVITAVHNGAYYIGQALASIQAQTYRPLESIVVDDGSSDESGAIARQFPVRYLYQANQGIARARNRALELARGKLVAFLDQDDYWAPRKLELQVSYLRAHPDVDLVLGKEHLFFDEGFDSPLLAEQPFLKQDHLNTAPGLWLIRRRAFDAVGWLDSRYRVADDLDWFMRFCDAGLRYGAIPETLLYKRLHGRNASLQIESIQAEVLAIYRTSIQRRRGQSAKG